MKKPTFFFALILAFLNATAQRVTERNLLANKYTANSVAANLISKEKWHPYPRTAAEWAAAVPDSTLKRIIKTGEEALEKPIPVVTATLLMDFVRSGDRIGHSTASFGKRNRLTDLVLAESMEGKGRFMEAILNLVWSICEETYWGVPAHLSVQKAKNGLPDVEDPTVDLFGAETAAILGITDYLVGDQLDKISPLIRKRITLEVNRKILDPVKNWQRYGWLSKTHPVNNWNPWIVSNLMVAGLMLEKDEKKRADDLYYYMTLLDRYLNGLGEDGGCDEGPSYWFAAGASTYDALETLADATGGKANIFDVPLIQRMASYVYKTHISDDYFVNFADADPTVKGDGYMLYRFGKAIKDDKLTQFGVFWANRRPQVAAGGFHFPRKIENLLTIKKLPFSENSYTPVKEAWFPDIQVMVARDNTGLFVAAHGGHNAESHNHNDVGDFILYSNGEPVIVDAGRGNYTARTFSSKRYELWFTRSEYHNLPIINNIGQPAGLQYAASDAGTVFNDKEAVLNLDIAKAYPKEAGINSWKRNVTLNRVKPQVQITDNYDLASAPKSLEQVFVTINKVDTSRPGAAVITTPSGQSFTLQYDSKQWNISTDYPSTEGMEYSSFKTKWNNLPVQRIILTSKVLKNKSRLNYTISKN